MKASEYGGSDTDKTYGIQPVPHRLTPDEKLRLMYLDEPATETSSRPPEVEPE